MIVLQMFIIYPGIILSALGPSPTKFRGDVGIQRRENMAANFCRYSNSINFFGKFHRHVSF